MSYRISIFVILVALFAADDALAQRDFLPTDTEWYQWPEYCRVRYGGDRAGQNSKFHSMITPAQTAALKASIGEQAYYYLHHHCYGVGHYFRAQAATTPQVAARSTGSAGSVSALGPQPASNNAARVAAPTILIPVSRRLRPPTGDDDGCSVGQMWIGLPSTAMAASLSASEWVG